MVFVPYSGVFIVFFPCFASLFYIQAHQIDNMRIMQENVALVKEINDLHRDIKTIRQKQREQELSGSAQLAPAAPANGTTLPPLGPAQVHQ